MRTTYAILGIVLLLAACAPSQAPEERGESAPMEEMEEAYEEAYEEGYEEAAGEGAAGAEADAVAQLNEMCPENWCMGDYQYEFLEIACAGASCTLSFTAERDGESLDGTVELDYDEPLIDEFGDLEPGYFERVTDALDEWESAQAGA